MANRKKKKTSYDDSMVRIFIWSGFDVFVIMLITCIAIALIAFYCNRLDADGIKLVRWCFLMAFPVSYALPMISLLKVWRQERILGIYWKDRTDQNRPVQERDWYLYFDRGGFILCHWSYIQRILKSWVVEQTTGWGREKIHCVKFEDISGKKHTLRFSSSSEQKRFRQWYKKKVCINENGEAE